MNLVLITVDYYVAQIPILIRKPFNTLNHVVAGLIKKRKAITGKLNSPA